MMSCIGVSQLQNKKLRFEAAVGCPEIFFSGPLAEVRHLCEMRKVKPVALSFSLIVDIPAP